MKGIYDRGPCKHCGGSLPCIPCRNLNQQKWVEANRERVRATKKAYESRYPERVIVAKAKNRAVNGEEYRRRQSARRSTDKPSRNAYERASYARDPTPFIVRNQRRELRDRMVGGEFTQQHRSDMFAAQSGACANPYCKTDLSVTGFHADHKTPVLLGGPHDATNRQLLCPTCNHRKGTLTNEQFLERQSELARKA